MSSSSTDVAEKGFDARAASSTPRLAEQSPDRKSRASSHDDEEKGLAHVKDGAATITATDNASPPSAPHHHGAGSPPPDGGLTAWLQVLGGWMLFFNTWGLLNTFGVYQTYYESNPYWHASSSTISWIGSVQAVCVLFGGVIAGPIYDRGHLRPLLFVGSFFIVFGHMMLSLARTYWEVLLAQGFCIGLGASALFIPSVAIMPTYFSKNLGLAIGLAASGSSTGGIIYPIMFFKLVKEVGFPWGVRILGFTVLATLIIPNLVMKMRVQPAKVRAFIDWTVFTDWPFLLFVFGTIIGFIGLYCAIFYTSFYGLAKHLTDESLSFYLVPILNAGSVLGRTLPNWLSDKIGPFNVIAPGSIMVGVILLCYLSVKSAGGLIVCTLLFGFFSGIFIAMPPVLFVVLTKDKSKIGTRIGMGFAILTIGVLCGGPGGGAILGNSTSGDLHWQATWIYAGVSTLGAGCIFTALRIMRGGLRLNEKV